MEVHVCSPSNMLENDYRLYGLKWNKFIWMAGCFRTYSIKLDSDRVIEGNDDVDKVQGFIAFAGIVFRIIVNDSLLIVWLTLSKKADK